MGERMSPAKRAKQRSPQMTRADSLSSVREFGSVLQPPQQIQARKKKAQSNSLFGKIKKALGGK